MIEERNEMWKYYYDYDKEGEKGWIRKNKEDEQILPFSLSIQYIY